ncbi:MAG: hypothetical protein VKL59_23795 [Nostocaceae cyanobacterium]|nr:hypothetical protein [Nostocaceae cyanobacterium]
MFTSSKQVKNQQLLAIAEFNYKSLVAKAQRRKKIRIVLAEKQKLLCQW